MKELELKKPIIAHGETLSVLEFDEAHRERCPRAGVSLPDESG